MEIKNHRIVGIPFRASPNIGGVITPEYLIQHFDASPNSTGAISWMVSPQSKVSAHLHLDRDGNLVQLVDFNKRANHAGESNWRGIIGLNSHSIGIEIQNTGNQEYTKAQYDKLIEVSKLLKETYSLKEIIGHEDIAPIRKSDPSGSTVDLFDWVTLLRGCCMNVETHKAISDLNIRRGQGTQYPIVSKVIKNDEVYVLNTVGEWSKIQLVGSNQCGWVNNKYLL